ncbi:MAG TPA: DUF3568 family protein [Candidatus Saccharimonadales bacterium]|nr:DUF3568 family protein [Candidatus Saccharimonadales bacterium]
MKALGCLVSCITALLISGCVNTVDGRREVGVPFVKDQVQGRYPRPIKEVWTSSRDVLGFNGALTSEDFLRGTMEATVDTKSVWVKVETLDPNLTQITVQVRTRNGGTDVELARELDKEIAIRLATGRLPSTPAPKQQQTKPVTPK